MYESIVHFSSTLPHRNRCVCIRFPSIFMLGGDWRERELLSAHGLTLLFLSLNCVLFPYASSWLFCAPEPTWFFCYIISILFFFFQFTWFLLFSCSWNTIPLQRKKLLQNVNVFCRQCKPACEHSLALLSLEQPSPESFFTPETLWRWAIRCLKAKIVTMRESGKGGFFDRFFTVSCV